MNVAQILERIIQEEGSCTWADGTVCDKCPLGRLARDRNGGFMSCVEALAIDGLTEAEADARYKKAAQEKLGNLAIDEFLET